MRKPTKSALDILVENAIFSSKTTRLRPVIEKEILHYEILNVMDKHRVLDQLVFQGGTCLRLVYGASRLSEDLDFTAGEHFDGLFLEELANLLKKDMSRRFGLEVFMTGPKPLTENTDQVKVKSWTLSVVTAAKRNDIPRQRIKIEVANVPAHTAGLKPIRKNYEGLPTGYQSLLLKAQTMQEIMTDKLVAYVNTSHIRYRDLWDLSWMHQNGVMPNRELLQKKCRDYAIASYHEKANARLSDLTEVVHSDRFRVEMERFLPPDVVAKTFAKDGFLHYLENANRALFETAIRLTKDKENKAKTTPMFTM